MASIKKQLEHLGEVNEDLYVDNERYVSFWLRRCLFQQHVLTQPVKQNRIVDALSKAVHNFPSTSSPALDTIPLSATTNDDPTTTALESPRAGANDPNNVIEVTLSSSESDEASPALSPTTASATTGLGLQQPQPQHPPHQLAYEAEESEEEEL